MRPLLLSSTRTGALDGSNDKRRLDDNTLATLLLAWAGKQRSTSGVLKNFTDTFPRLG